MAENPAFLHKTCTFSGESTLANQSQVAQQLSQGLVPNSFSTEWEEFPSAIQPKQGG